ncbi:MAG: tetratricopeptide repeat protein [Devosia sp.]
MAGFCNGQVCFAAADPAAGAPTLDQTVREGLMLHQAGRLEEASAIYRRVLAADPSHAEANHLLGLVLHQSGRQDEAAELIGKAVRQMPFNATYHANLGVVFKSQNRLGEAAQSYERSLKIDPKQGQVQSNLGVALLGLGRVEDAIAAQRQAIALLPQHAGAHHHLANALATAERLEEARISAERAVVLQPGNPDLHYALGRILMAQEKLKEAAGSLGRAVQIRPDSMACADLGKVLMGLKQPKEAAAAYEAAIATDPKNASLHFALGKAFTEVSDWRRAADSFRKATELRPEDATAFTSLGGALLSGGLMEEGEAALRTAVGLDGGDIEALSSLLFASNYHAGLPVKTITADARAFGEAVAHKVTPRRHHANVAVADKKLKVGLVSGDLRASAVSRFLISLLPEIDAARLELFAYSLANQDDAITEKLRRSIPHWRPATYMNHDELQTAILDDEIDVLIDLLGHTGIMRLPVFAGKPAPVTATWLGYSGTTGILNMDYIIADRHVAPPGAEDQFVETIWPMPDSYLCFTPPEAAPDVASLPALDVGHVTFGSFNNVNKLSQTTLALWARILEAVPTSRLVLKYGGLERPEVAGRILETLATAGADVTRVELLGAVDTSKGHFQTYNRLDIGLDPFPYNGTTTTCEALWMGVPVLTLSGDRFIARVGESLLNSAGLLEWVAADEDEYVAKAVAMASDLPRLAALRAALRPQMAASPLCDAPRFARNFETALRGMWVRWCESQARA